MKKIILILICFFSISCFAAKNKKHTIAVNNLLETMKFNQFISHIQKVKQTKSIGHIKQKDYKLKEFFSHKKLWYYFDHKNFKNNLVKKMSKNFNTNEINQITSYLKQPFVLKVVNTTILHRDIFQYHQDMYSELYKNPKIASSRYKLIENLYKLHGMDIQKEHLEKSMKKVVKSGKVAINVLSSKKDSAVLIDTKILKDRLENSKKFIIEYFAKDLKDFRHYEIRDYFRRAKKSKPFQKFLQIYSNYHFIYLTKYIEKVEQDKMDELKALKVDK